LKNAGMSVGLAAVVGESFAKQVAAADYEWYVVELSRCQLDGRVEFKPHIVVLTNITPDHVDRHEYQQNNYVASKYRITKNQTEQDFFIFDADDELSKEWLKENKIKAQKLPFSLQEKQQYGAYVEDQNIKIITQNSQFIMPTSSLALEGKHNTKNAMAASTVAQLLRIRKETIRASMENFQGVEHRLEKVLKINNVLYINDSKATNTNATYYALESM